VHAPPLLYCFGRRHNLENKMFRSKSKKIEESLAISMEEIEEDMLTFKHCVATGKNGDEWWRSFKTFESQMTALQENSENLNEYKQELETRRDDINNQRADLQQRFEKSLIHLRKLKSPS
jgi:uncharacterized protein (DUF342 family)